MRSANRCVGNVSQVEIETVANEDSDPDSDSSIENSVEYAPLGFSIVAGVPAKAQYKPKGVARSIDESEESDRELSFSDAPLVVTLQDNRSRALVQRRQEESIEAVESEPEVEPTEDDGKEEQLNAIVISNLVKRLRDPNAQVTTRDFENLEWDDPNFEDELKTLKQVATYIEVKETRLKMAKDNTLETSSVINQKIEDAVMTLPEITVVRVKDQAVEQARTYALPNKVGKETMTPAYPNKPLLGANSAKVIMVGSNGKVQVLTKEAYLGSRAARKTKMTESMLLTLDDSAAAMASKEAYLGSRAARKTRMTESMLLTLGDSAAAMASKEACVGSRDVEKKKRVDQLLSSQTNIPLTKEATFGEEEKPMRRKRKGNFCHQSVVISEVPDVCNDEIVETEYMNTEVLAGDTVEEFNKISRLPRQRQLSCRNPGICSVTEIVPDAPGRNHTAKEETAAPEKKTHEVARQRRRRVNKNRSITFADVVDTEEVEGVVEALEAQAISEPCQDKHSKESRGGKRTRHRHSRNDVSRSNISFSIIPDELADAIVEEDQATQVSLNATRNSGKSLTEKENPTIVPRRLTEATGAGDTGKANDGKSANKKRRHRHASACHRSRELECSLVPDAIWSEIAEREDALELTNRKSVAGAQLGEERSSGLHRGATDPTLRSLALGGSARRRNSFTGAHNKLNTSSNFAVLPEPEAGEAPDGGMGPRREAKATNDGESAPSAKRKTHKPRRARKNNPNRSSTSFVLVDEEEVVEMKEKVDENLDTSVSKRNVAKAGATRTALPRRRERRRKSAGGSMVSIEISGLETMEDTLDSTLNNTVKVSRVK
ncbi:axoneme central apparatus protein [Trypanosoma conorhini]|uniref:Axoneme central apparatus protein n=1 Tax=Trypanosoma conorhini TaxID=83891 RepID=A0A422Q8A5_9TRYP|nr:axoneme central apparatus protein [Trypanosoma conorhini]RNF26212.1 axoneme central apparatus protein [Trypanosoma conorhini]